MRLTLRHGYLPGDLDGCLFVAPLRKDAKNIYNAGGGIDAAAPATQVVDALGSFIHPATGLITPATANVLRIGSGLDLESRLKGALFEAARTNSCLQSEDLGTTWSTTRASTTVNDATSPDGTLTADKIVENSQAGVSHFMRQDISVTSGQKVVLSVFVKADERTEFLLETTGPAAPASPCNCWFDLNAGTQGTLGANADAAGIEDAGNGWYRCWLVFTAVATDTFGFLLVLGSGSETVTYNGDGVSGAHFWGMQVEENVPYPSSYIKTTTASVTRAADDIRFDNTSEANLKAASGTFYCAITHGTEIASGERRLFDSRVPGNADGIVVYLAVDNNHHVVVKSGSSTVANLDSGDSWSRKDTEVIAVSWKLNEFTIYINGVQKAQDTAGAAPTAVNATLYFGQSNVNSEHAEAQLAHFHIYDSVHDAARVLINTNEIKSWLGK